jgi:hypothetical protein
VQPDPQMSLPREVAVWEGETQLVVSGQDKTLVLLGGDCPVRMGDRVVVSNGFGETVYTVTKLVGRSGGVCYVGVVEA